MAISKNTRLFEMDGKMYRFNKESFSFYFDMYCRNNEITKEQLEIKLADELAISCSAIHNWRNGLNGPSTIDMIKNVAMIYGIDCLNLLKEEMKMAKEMHDELKNIKVYSDLQLLSIKRIYDSIVSFLDEFRNTGGFTTTMWYDFLDKGFKDPESAIYDYVEGEMKKINLVIMQEFFYLHDLPIYDEICEFYNDLYDMYDGKLGYAYRVEAFAEGNPTTDDDFYKALDKVNKIILDCVKTI